jgi:hypothetical protein
MPHTPPPQGLFVLPDLDGIVEQVTKLLPGVASQIADVLPSNVTDALSSTIGKLLDPTDNSINIGDPQPPGTPPIPVAPGSPEISAVINGIDAALAAIGVLRQLKFIVSEKNRPWLDGLAKALETIRSWLT